LRLGLLVEPHRILDADDGRVANASRQQPGQPAEACEVTGTYGGHLDDLPFDELDSIVLVEYPGLGRAVVVVDGTTPPCDLLRLRIHARPPVVRSSHREVYPSETALPHMFSDLSTCPLAALPDSRVLHPGAEGVPFEEPGLKGDGYLMLLDPALRLSFASPDANPRPLGSL
jgi:hypothetical protein